MRITIQITITNNAMLWIADPTSTLTEKANAY